jgi:peptide/nickel transport system ATP-binding protein
VQPTRCRDEVPPLRKLGEGHFAACHWVEEIKAGKIEPQQIEAVFEPGAVPVGAYEPPPS